MAARYQKHQVGKGDTIGKLRGQRMPREVIDADQGQTRRRAQALGAHYAREDPANQAWSSGDGDRVYLI